MSVKVGDKVRQIKSGPFQARVAGLVGTVVSIEEDEEYPIYVNFPQIDKGVWPFRRNEIELVEEEGRA